MQTNMIVPLLVLVSVVAIAADSSPGFMAAAKELEDAMDFTVDPCDNFFLYSCGNWPVNKTGRYDTDIFTRLYVQVLDDMAQKIQNLEYGDMRYPKAYGQLKLAFDACVKEPPSDPTKDMQLLLQLLKEFGGWPVIDKMAPGNPGGPAGALGALTGQFGFETLITPQVTNDLWNPGRVTVLFDVRQVQSQTLENGTVIPYIPDSDVLAEYVEAVALRIGGNMTDQDQLRKDAKEIADIEVQSVTATWEAYNWVQPDPYVIPAGIYHPHTVSSAIKQWPDINWPMMLIQMAKNNTDLLHIFGYPFVVTYPSYMDFVNNLFATRSPRTMQNYFMWKLVEFENSMLPSMRDLFKKYNPIHGAKATELHCSSQLVTALPAVTSRLYSELSPLTQRDIDELSTMIGTVLAAWQGMIGETEWIDDKSRQNAYAKIAQVARKVAFPAWVMQDSALDAYYDRLDLTPEDDSFTGVNKAQRFFAWKQFSTLGQAVDRYSWLQSASVVNAWYRPDYNSITFPAAIMQSPFFNASYPKSVNYGDTGATMGHELGHAFDANGVFWGPFGGYNPDTWMDSSSRHGFDQMSGCVVNQYDKYCYPELPGKPCINGNNTITENVADNGGTVAALRAYKAVLALMGGEPALPGKLSKMTNEQVYYISYAHSWCSREDPASIEYLINHDVHSPARYRVIGVLQNMPEFAKAFQCKTGTDYMAPTEHCNVWVKPR